MSVETFDVIIVGAGPAGSFAAEHLAHRGASVALYDGRPPGEPKACGGGVTSKALKAWPQLREASGRIVDSVEMYAPSGKHVRLQLDEPFAIYSRRTLDAYLRERARAAGAHVFAERASVSASESDLWEVRDGAGNERRAKFLVAADGANSSIARRLAGALPPAEMEVAFGYRAPLSLSNAVATDDAPATVIAFLPHWAGYAWAFPRLDHISFGIATTQDAFDHQALDQMLWRFMIDYYQPPRKKKAALQSWATASENGATKRDEEARENLRASCERYAARIPGLSAEMWNARRTAGHDWALIGDAAGFADPVTGEGIYYAMRSAEIFAASFIENAAHDYEQRWRADFGRELIRAAEMRQRFYGTFKGAPFTERMIALARLHPGMRRTLRELVAGDQGYLDLKSVLSRRLIWPY